ncbi:MAG TPA: hypothetical protein VGN12_18990 [Pirellulales bacterium]|jgi:hypothetical protein
MKRRTFVRGLGAGIALGPAAFSASAAKALEPEAVNPHLTRIHPPFMITAKEAQAWHVAVWRCWRFVGDGDRLATAR